MGKYAKVITMCLFTQQTNQREKNANTFTKYKKYKHFLGNIKIQTLLYKNLETLKSMSFLQKIKNINRTFIYVYEFPIKL